MSLKSFFSSPRAGEASLDRTTNAGTTGAAVEQKDSHSNHIAIGLRKVFRLHFSKSHRELHSNASALALPPQTPAQLYRFESPKATKPLDLDTTPSSPPVSEPRPANSSSPSPLSVNTAPTTPDSIAPTFIPGHTQKTSATPEYEAALAGLRDAEKLLEQRHTVVKSRPEATKKRISPSAVPRKSKKPKSARTSHLPSHLPTPFQKHRQESRTANEACDTHSRRQLVKDLTYRAAGGCDDAIIVMEELNTHFLLQNRHANQEIPDLVLNFNGVLFCASDLRNVERTWISRFNAIRRLQGLVVRKRVSAEDYEQIATQLFPAELKELLRSECFEIFLSGLSCEGIISEGEAKNFTRLAVSSEEFETGARWTGQYTTQTRYAGQHRRNPSALTIFDIPKQAHSTFPSISARATPGQPNLYSYLRILVEAAVYEQTFWKGYFFANARSKLNDFHLAHKMSQEGRMLPPHLTDYRRDWTYYEGRVLARAHLVCTLLASCENRELTDFGIIRVVRGTFSHLPGQVYWDVEDLSTFLYHRVVNSGLPFSTIPEVLALHPDNDANFTNVRFRARVLKELEERNEMFEKEEEQRLKEIETSVTTFESLKKKEMGRWKRMKVGMKRLFGCGLEVEAMPFDPFAEKHERC